MSGAQSSHMHAKGDSPASTIPEMRGISWISYCLFHLHRQTEAYKLHKYQTETIERLRCYVTTTVLRLTLRIGGVPFLIFNSNVIILRSFFSSGDKLSSSTSTSSLSKYCMSSGFIVGRLPFGCRSTTAVLLSGVCMRKPTGVPARGVGVAVSLRAGVRMGT